MTLPAGLGLSLQAIHGYSIPYVTRRSLNSMLTVRSKVIQLGNIYVLSQQSAVSQHAPKIRNLTKSSVQYILKPQTQRTLTHGKCPQHCSRCIRYRLHIHLASSSTVCYVALFSAGFQVTIVIITIMTAGFGDPPGRNGQTPESRLQSADDNPAGPQTLNPKRI